MRDLSLWISGCGVGSVVAEHAVSCSMARGILVPWPGTEPASQASQGGFLITQTPGESPALTVISLSSYPNMSVIFMNKCFLWVQVNERKWEHDAFRKWPRFHCSAAASWPEDRQQESPMRWRRLHGASLSASCLWNFYPNRSTVWEIWEWDVRCDAEF